MIDWTSLKCTCGGFEDLTCLNCIVLKNKGAMNNAYLKTYDAILKNWDGEKKLTTDELAVVKYCADNNLHPV